MKAIGKLNLGTHTVNATHPINRIVTEITGKCYSDVTMMFCVSLFGGTISVVALSKLTRDLVD